MWRATARYFVAVLGCVGIDVISPPSAESESGIMGGFGGPPQATASASAATAAAKTNTHPTAFMAPSSLWSLIFLQNGSRAQST